MKEEVGDLWTYPSQYIAITTNGIVSDLTNELIMGKGVALKAKELFPELPKILGKYVSTYGNRAFIVKEHKIITFPTKYHWRDNSSLLLIEKSAKEVVEIVDKYKIQSIACPRFGCGNGGLDWKTVKKWVANILDDRFIIVGDKNEKH